MAKEARRAQEVADVRVWRLLERIECIQDRIDEAFGGRALLPHLEPTARANRLRMESYLRLRTRVQNLLLHAAEVYMSPRRLNEDPAIEKIELEAQRLDEQLSTARLTRWNPRTLSKGR